jgi:hypothetical protein
MSLTKARQAPHPDSQLRPLSPSTVRATLGAAALCIGLGAVLGGFFRGVPLGDDNSSHLAEIMHIARLLRMGETDFWFDQTNLGYPLFLAYQPGPSLLMGALVALCQTFLEPLLLFKLSVVLLWALMPSAWYLGGRWLGMDRLSALFFGLLILCINDFRAFGLGMSSLTDTGLYTQSYGTILLPLAMGALYRHLLRRDLGPKLPTLLFSATLLAHAYFGLYLALGAAVMLVAQRQGFRQRAYRLAVVFGLSALLTAFWLLPFIHYMNHQGGLPWKSAAESGYPPLELSRLAVTGALFDHGRLPWISVLVGAGIWLAWKRRAQTLERFTLMLLGVTLALLLGRTTWGRLYGWIPLHSELEVIRYLNGVHFCGLLLAGPAAAFLLRRVSTWFESRQAASRFVPRRVGPTLFAAVLVGGYLVAVTATSARQLRAADETKLHLPGLEAALASDSSSRFLAHQRLGTGSHFYLNLLPARAERAQLESFSRGYHDTLSLYYLEAFDFTEASFRLYNVGALAARGQAFEEVPDFLKVRWTDGEFQVYEYPEAGGYFEFVRTPLTLVGDLKAIRPVAQLLSPRLFAVGALPRLSSQVDSDDDALLVPSDARVSLVRGEEEILENKPATQILGKLIHRYRTESRRSTVVDEQHGPNAYSAIVDAAGAPERLLLKASFHPLWTAEIDGQSTTIEQVAPNLMAVDVPAGRHRVRFRYRNPVYQKVLFLGSLLFVLCWLGTDAARGRRRHQLG